MSTNYRKILSMESSRFDILARSLTTARSRRAALAALLGGSLGLRDRPDTTAKGKQAKAVKKSKKAKPGPAGPVGPTGPAGPSVGLAGLTFVVQKGPVTTVNSSVGQSGTSVFNCPPGGVISSVSVDLRPDVTGLSFMSTTSTGPGNLTVKFTRDAQSTIPAQFVATVICLVLA